MDEKKELDAFGIPAGTRPKYFAFKVFGGWGAASVMFFIMLRCFTARSAEQQAYGANIINVQTEARKQARAEVKEDYEYMMRMLEDREERLQILNKRIDTLKSGS